MQSEPETELEEEWKTSEEGSVRGRSPLPPREMLPTVADTVGARFTVPILRHFCSLWRVCGGFGKPRKSWLGFPKRQGRPAFPSFSGLHERSFLQVFLGFPVDKRAISVIFCNCKSVKLPRTTCSVFSAHFGQAAAS